MLSQCPFFKKNNFFIIKLSSSDSFQVLEKCNGLVLTCDNQDKMIIESSIVLMNKPHTFLG
jgi:hypothetical protein